MVMLAVLCKTEEGQQICQWGKQRICRLGIRIRVVYSSSNSMDLESHLNIKC